MKYFIFRNYTIEPFFKGQECAFSGYEDISFIDRDADGYIWFYLAPYRVSPDRVAKEIAHYGHLLDLTLSGSDASKPFLLFTIHPVYTIHYQTSAAELEEAVYQYNQKLYQLAEDNLNVKVIRTADFYDGLSGKELIDWRFYWLSQMPLNPKLSPAFSQWLKRQLEIVEMKRKKCIVVDLDNTLWGGILGEDGMERIKIGGDYPGNAYLFFQEYLLELSKNGILLAVCSKNNEKDVWELWNKHPDLLLRKSHFAVCKINWRNKADNIKEIAAELNIAPDSMVFIDDSPTERELVRQMLPQVSVPDFPDQPYLYPEFIRNLTGQYFSTYRLTKEDTVKTQQYQENVRRQAFQQQFVDLESYLRSLHIELTIEPLDNFNIVRFAQMTQKTNQFNLTTRRYTETDIYNIAQRGGWVYGLSVKDRFGDSGLTGLIIIDIRKDKADIDTFLLSCRILGKDIEKAFLSYMLLKLKNSDINKVHASYIQTEKNSQVADFYDKAGFELKNKKENVNTYYLSLDRFTYILPDIYQIKEK